MIDKQKEEQFYANDKFCFSYSSLNRLLFSPSLFYKDYILKDKEIKTDKYLVEGKLVHCLVFEPESLKDKFSIVPGKAPSDNIRKVLKNLTLYTDSDTIKGIEDEIIDLNFLDNQNLDILLQDQDRIVVLSRSSLIDFDTISTNGLFNSPSTFNLKQGMTLTDAVILSGGFKNDAAKDNVS